MAQFENGAQPAPEFQHVEIKEVESVVGQMVLLPCTVTNLGDRMVSYFLKRLESIYVWNVINLTASLNIMNRVTKIKRFLQNARSTILSMMKIQAWLS